MVDVTFDLDDLASVAVLQQLPNAGIQKKDRQYGLSARSQLPVPVD